MNTPTFDALPFDEQELLDRQLHYIVYDYYAAAPDKVLAFAVYASTLATAYRAPLLADISTIALSMIEQEA